MKGSHKWGWYHPRKFATESNYPVTVESDVDTETDGAEEVGRVYQDVPHKDIEDGKYQVNKYLELFLVLNIFVFEKSLFCGIKILYNFSESKQ